MECDVFIESIKREVVLAQDAVKFWRTDIPRLLEEAVAFRDVRPCRADRGKPPAGLRKGRVGGQAFVESDGADEITQSEAAVRSQKGRAETMSETSGQDVAELQELFDFVRF